MSRLSEWLHETPGPYWQFAGKLSWAWVLGFSAWVVGLAAFAQSTDPFFGGACCAIAGFLAFLAVGYACAAVHWWRVARGHIQHGAR